MSQSKITLSVVMTAILIGTFASAQMNFDLEQCQSVVSSSTNKFIDTNRALLADLQTKATKALGESVQLDQFTSIIDRMNEELTKMADHLQDLDASEVINSFVKIGQLQTEVYQLFLLNPRFALVFYDAYLEYIVESTKKNTDILSQIPAKCIPSRRQQPTQ